MTDAEMLELCKRHFEFLGRAVQHTYLRDAETKQRITSRKVIADECAAAVDKITQHQRATDKIKEAADGAVPGAPLPASWPVDVAAQCSDANL